MASGFIILHDNRCLAVRHALHDAVLLSVAAQLAVGDQLREWLRGQIPSDGDTDLGYASVRSDGEHVERVLDLRGLTAENQSLFVAAARSCKPLASVRAPATDVEACLRRLRAMLAASERGDPPLALSDWTRLAPPCERRIGPGWGDRS
jgi:hypothetical protein